MNAFSRSMCARAASATSCWKARIGFSTSGFAATPGTDSRPIVSRLNQQDVFASHPERSLLPQDFKSRVYAAAFRLKPWKIRQTQLQLVTAVCVKQHSQRMTSELGLINASFLRKMFELLLFIPWKPNVQQYRFACRLTSLLFHRVCKCI